MASTNKKLPASGAVVGDSQGSRLELSQVTVLLILQSDMTVPP
jgi:hypothetical protein